MIPLASTPATRGLRRRQVIQAGGYAALGLPIPLTAGCSGDRGAAVKPGTDQVTMLTSFGLFGRDSYPLVASERGFFAEADLEVTVQPGPGAAADKLAALRAGEAQFAAIDLSGAIIAAGQGPTGCTALAAIHQLFPAALMTTNPAITTPQDLVGRTIAMPSGAIPDLLFPSYAQLSGLDPNEVERVNAPPQQLPQLLAAGTVDAIDQFVFGLPTVQAAVGDNRAVTMLPYSDVLTDLYGIALVTTIKLAFEQPDLCRRFRDALLRGLEYSLDHPAEAGRILAEVEESAHADVAAAELEIMEPYSRQAGIPLGAINEVKVAQNIALLEAVEAIPAGMAAAEIVDLDLAVNAD